MSQRWPLQSEFFSVIQSEVTRLAQELMKGEKLSKSRATIKAVDRVATFQIDPPTSGQHLESWLGQMRSLGRWGQLRGKEEDDDKAAPTPETAPTLLTPMVDDADDFGAKGDVLATAVINEMTSMMRMMQVGQVRSFMVKNKAEAMYLYKRLPYVVNRLGWRNAPHTKAYRAKVLDDRLKIKRLA